MLVIQYDKRRLLGGYGDRIIGLISIKVISKLLKKKFYILWTKENIIKYIDYKKYDFELLKISKKNIKHFHYIDKQKGLKKYLMTSSKPFPYKINMFRLNQEISQYLHKNKKFIKEDYFKNIMNEYKNLYADVLKPTKFLLDKVKTLLQNKSNIIGIQIRCGDRYMVTNKGAKHQTNECLNIDNKLLKIKDICDKIFNKNNYHIFFTTDNIKIFNNILKIFDSKIIIYESSLIQHLDRNKKNNNFSKIFIDNYILSQKTKILFISLSSNFGRVSALSCHHNNIYNLNGKMINKKILVSKHEKLFR